MTTKLILRSNLSPGDIVMLTAAVRDLHAAYPGEYLTDVRTPCPALWEHNPHIVPIADDDAEARVIEMHYPLIQRSNSAPYHFIHGYRMYLEEALGRRIEAGAFRGDVHLSVEERGWMSQVEEREGRGVRYWIIVSGGKRDFTAKWWDPARYQAVVDHFAGRIRFVQVGEAGHAHPPLRGVLDLRGQTTLRQLVRLVHHADGVLCPVTSLMHLAAAVPMPEGRAPLRPCVVVAGGREPSQWEAYPGHRYLDTVGALPCCAGGGCWKSRVVPLGDGDEKDGSLCVRPVEVGGGLHIPQCLELVSVEAVVRAVESYLAAPVPERVARADVAVVARGATGRKAGAAACCGNGAGKPVKRPRTDPASWGPGKWRELHERPDKAPELAGEGAWLERFGKSLPCPECQAHLMEWVREYPPKLESADAYFAWTVELHNAVNRRVGKSEYSLEMALGQRATRQAIAKRWATCKGCAQFAEANASEGPRCAVAGSLRAFVGSERNGCPEGKWGAVGVGALGRSAERQKTMFIACNATYEAGHKIGDMITMAHAARLIAKNEPHERYILSLNPKHPLNFVFDQFIQDFRVDVVLDKWPVGRQAWENREFEERRRSRSVRGVHFDTYKELYRRVDGSMRQALLCGSERGLGRRNIFEYYFFGQEHSPAKCEGAVDFGSESFGWKRDAKESEKTVFVAPHAHSQGNDVFTMKFWREVIEGLLAAGLEVIVNTPNDGLFGMHKNLTYSFHHGNMRRLFQQISEQRLVVCGNTGIGWIAAAHGVPLIAGEPKHFWFMDYRYREAGVRSVVEVFSEARPIELKNLVVGYFEGGFRVTMVYSPNVPNIGDRCCSPADYFPLIGRRIHVEHLERISGPIVFGGGGLTWAEKEMNAWLRKSYIKIGWGIGMNAYGNDPKWPGWMEDFDLLGVRDFGTKYRWVPCASCMSALFDNAPEPSCEVVFYDHYEHKMDAVDEVPRLSNNVPEMSEAIQFLSRGRYVVTNSYHGAYWAILLGRRVVVVNPKYNKFHFFKHPPIMVARASEWREASTQAVQYSNALNECREANRSFFEDVKMLLARSSGK